MTQKIENVLMESIEFSFYKTEAKLPLLQIPLEKSGNKKYKMIFHIGSSGLRKLSPEKEKEIIESIYKGKWDRTWVDETLKNKGCEIIE